MKLRAITSTLDGRLSKGKLYDGKIMSTSKGIRVLLYSDNRLERMTFDPRVFTYEDPINTHRKRPRGKKW